jgi:hypothetical protein
MLKYGKRKAALPVYAGAAFRVLVCGALGRIARVARRGWGGKEVVSAPATIRGNIAL